MKVRWHGNERDCSSSSDACQFQAGERKMTLAMQQTKPASAALVVLPFYSGDLTVESALDNPKGAQLLWLEILFNEQFPWRQYLTDARVKTAYEKACVWHGQFKTMIDGRIGPRSLGARTGDIDAREWRKFQEALTVVTRRA